MRISISAWLAFSLVISPVEISSLLRPHSFSVRTAQAAEQAESSYKSSDESNFESEISHLLEAGEAAYDNFEDVASAELYQQALSLIAAQENEQKATYPWLTAQALYGVGRANGQLRNYDVARPALEEALAILEANAEEDAPASFSYAGVKIDLYGILGLIAKDTGGYATALGYSRAGLALAQSKGWLPEAAIFHHNNGGIEADIDQYTNAEASLQAAIALSQQVDMPDLEASAVFTLGWMEERQENFEAAIARYQNAITLFSSIRQAARSLPPASEEQTEDYLSEDYLSENYLTEEELNNIISREIRTHNNLGIVYLKQGNLEQAQSSFDQGFALLNQKDDPIERSLLIDSVGSLHKANGNIEQAWTNYLQAWQLSHQNSDTAGEIAVLLNLGELMETQAEPALAIFFYKQAVAQLETIRTDLQQLSQTVQQRYTHSVESAYRTLAGLLLQQGREAEALQVLELLKLQEVKTYLHNEGEGRTAGAQQFNTPAEAALLEVLKTLPTETSLAEFVVHPAAIALKTAPNSDPSSNQSSPKTTTENTFRLKAVEALKNAIAQQPTNTAALYPLILEDRLEILLFTSTGTVERFTTQVPQTQLQATVSDLQRALQNKAIDAKPAAQQLHQWLIQPLTEVLAAQQIENIIYLPDSVLRYVPLAALHDGNQWLIETYQSHTITSATIDDLTAQQEAPLGVMAGAFTDSSVVHQVDVGTRSFAYAGLSAAQQEVDNLLRALPASTALLNEDFSPEQLLKGVGDRPILHLATHAQFIPGEPEDSFILFGDGRTVTLRGLQQWQLPNVDLVVLSACQTASSTDGDGKEILGLGYQIQATGAKAAIASLWSVDDTATAALMSQFYKHLSASKPKAAALRAAQIDLIQTPTFENPYDWAAFILIGNGL